MTKQAKLDFNKPMTRELIIRVIDREMGMKKQPEERGKSADLHDADGGTRLCCYR